MPESRWNTGKRRLKATAEIKHIAIYWLEDLMRPKQQIQSSGGPLAAQGIPPAEFMLLTKIPIVIYYGDFIPKEPMANPGQDGWRARLEMARKWGDAVNKRGGDVTVVHLPEVGIRGNTHFPFSDLNNLQIADLMSTWLNKKGLDKYPKRSGRSKGL
jgi:hypothetical protein